jgi:hypothetical protein
MLMTKSATDGYDVGKKYAQGKLQDNGNKLVPALATIKVDIKKRMSFFQLLSCHTFTSKNKNARNNNKIGEDVLRNSGRVRILPSQPIFSLKTRHHPSASTREDILSHIELEDQSLKLCLTQKHSSPYAKELWKTYKCKEDRQVAFAGLMGEAKFRAARAKYWTQCKAEGKEGDGLYRLMDEWERVHDNDPEFRAPG